jgi:formylglycine-generating enzyme required for sulfatase activity
MASIDDLYCVDRYEASLVEVLPNGEDRPFSPFSSVEGRIVRAVSEPGLVPQAHINAVQAAEACRRSGKRLCKPAEWKKACMGPEKKVYGYGDENVPRRCNDHGRSPVTALFGGGGDPSSPRFWNWEHMNDPQLNQLPNTVAKTGEHGGCTNGYGVYDMVGNLHEWVDDPAGTFLGGYYQDIHENGDGCGYRTMAHDAVYHDYSTGFRCCADVAP